MKENWSETLSFLQEKGLSRLLILGGASLASSLLMEDKIDELQLTLTPRIIGGQNSWIPLNIGNLPKTLSKHDAWELKENQRIGNDEILLSYKRRRSS